MNPDRPVGQLAAEKVFEYLLADSMVGDVTEAGEEALRGLELAAAVRLLPDYVQEHTSQGCIVTIPSWLWEKLLVISAAATFYDREPAEETLVPDEQSPQPDWP